MFCGDLGLWFREISIMVKATSSRTNFDWDTNSQSIDIQQYYLAYSVRFLTDFTITQDNSVRFLTSFTITGMPAHPVHLCIAFQKTLECQIPLGGPRQEVVSIFNAWLHLWQTPVAFSMKMPEALKGETRFH